MRFVLYFFTWAIVYGTFSALAQADWVNFTTGIFLSAPMLWWSKVVRDRRRRKLGISPKPVKVTKTGSRLKRSFQAARVEWGRAPFFPGEETRRDLSEIDSSPPVDSESEARDVEMHAEAESDEPEEETVEISGGSSVSAVSEASEASDLSPETSREPSSNSESVDEDAPEAEVLVPEAAPMNPAPAGRAWRDSNGKIVHVGAQVSFLAKSKGESVSIPGLLLGERDGKAVIEVQGGALLPPNEYLIPWQVVSHRT